MIKNPDKMNKTFIFDLDDTLIYNHYCYLSPQADFIEFMLKKMNCSVYQFFDLIRLKRILAEKGKFAKNIREIIKEEKMDKLLDEIISTQIDISLDMCNKNKENPFSKERFPESFKQTYFALCEKYNLPIDDTDAERVYEIGTGFWNVKKNLIEGAEDVLIYLKEKGDKLMLLTGGDNELQEKKVKINNLDRWFDKITIVGNKENGILEEIVEDKKNTYMVGNSIKSDINPALSAGIKAIYIPFKTWEYEEQHEGFKSHDVIQLKNISDIIKIYDSL